MKKSILFSIVTIFILAISCSEDEIKNYDGRAFIYFGAYYYNNKTNWDTLKVFNFYLNPGVNDTIYPIKVVTGGKVTDEDRVFYVKMEAEGGIEGVHYNSVPQKQIIPAGHNTSYIGVHLYNGEGLAGNTFKIKLTLEESEDFKLQLPNIYSDKDTIQRTFIELDYKAEIDEPPLWTKHKETLIGYWSVAKFNEMNKLWETTMDDWLDSDSKLNDNTNFRNYIMYFANYLSQKVAEGVDKAIKDPDKNSDRGYMTITGESLSNWGIPKTDIPAQFPTTPEWEGKKD